jgi:hypothetical protein
MRPPRYRFPEEVRSTTRRIATRMVREGTIADSPEELDAWLSLEPEASESLRRGGYGSAFTPHDLFPLLQVFIVQAGGPATGAESPPRASKIPWLGIIAIVIGIALVLFAVAAGALS